MLQNRSAFIPILQSRKPYIKEAMSHIKVYNQHAAELELIVCKGKQEHSGYLLTICDVSVTKDKPSSCEADPRFFIFYYHVLFPEVHPQSPLLSLLTHIYITSPFLLEFYSLFKIQLKFYLFYKVCLMYSCQKSSPTLKLLAVIDHTNYLVLENCTALW